MPNRPGVASAGRICIVANELPYLFRNGGIGTHNWLLADALSAAGWNVHILYSSEIEDPAQLRRCRRACSEKGIILWHLDEFTPPAEDSFRCGLAGWIDSHSMRIRRAVEKLDAIQQFDLIEFAEWSGYAFRTVQARAMGIALADARIIVKLHASSQWCRDANRMWLNDTDDLIRDYFERYSFEQADFQLSPSRYMLSYAKSVGWNVRDDARVVRYHYPESAAQVRKPHGGPTEFVFFGRLELRKGLKLFCEVARNLPHHVSIAFLGRENSIDGMPATELISAMMGSRPYVLHTDLDRHEAAEYLAGPNRVAVVPSLTENYPFTVLECATSGIPFLAASVGGIPEIVADEDLRKAILFEPTPRALRMKIDQYLASDQDERHRHVERMHEIADSRRHNAGICQDYVDLLNDPRSHGTASTTEVATEQPLVSVVVPYFNLGEFLPATLRSLAEQDYPHVEVIVVNDGSTDPFSMRIWEEMKSAHPDVLFIAQENQGLGGARNTGLAAAKGEFFLPVDADNIARPGMISRFVQTMRRNPDLAAATCFHLAFETEADIAKGRFAHAYRPCGGPLVVAAIRNVYGDANAMFRTATLRAAGGYSAERDLGYEDWELFVKLASQGHRIDVVPEYLFYYRHRPDSMLRTTDKYLNRCRVLRQFFAVSKLPRAEQIELWMALAGFERPDKSTHGHHRKHRTGLRLAAYRFKHTMRRAPVYRAITATLKQLKQRAA